MDAFYTCLHATKLAYNNSGFSLLRETFARVLNAVAGKRAPIRKRRARVQKKIDKRRGAFHYSPIYFER